MHRWVRVLQDTESYSIKEQTKLNFIKPILTAKVFLAELGLTDVLR